MMKTNEREVPIFNIQRYSTHDGPGIRTTVFFAGCPLRCAWCHNPEGLMADSADAKLYTVPQLMAVIRRDRRFYDETGGGVTFSGGECMLHVDFLVKLAAACKKEGISVAIDTCGHTNWQDFERILPLADLFLYDVKLTDPAAHEKHTGVDNKLILENLDKLSNARARIWLRFPIIGGVNMDDAHIDALADICSKIKHESVHLLPYHPLADGKRAKMGLESDGGGFYRPAEEELAGIKHVLKTQRPQQ